MATAGPNTAGTGTNVADVGTIAWTNPDRIVSENASFATATTALTNRLTNYLKGTNFGFALLLDARIQGILVEWNRKVSAGKDAVATDTHVKIVKDGVVGSTNKSAAATWSTTLGRVSFGGSADLWGELWGPEDINDTTFGCVIAPTINVCTASVDDVRITVTYTYEDAYFPTTFPKSAYDCAIQIIRSQTKEAQSYGVQA